MIAYNKLQLNIDFYANFWFYNAFYEIPFLLCFRNSLVRKDINEHERLSSKHVINQESIELIRFNLLCRWIQYVCTPREFRGIRVEYRISAMSYNPQGAFFGFVGLLSFSKAQLAFMTERKRVSCV